MSVNRHQLPKLIPEMLLIYQLELAGTFSAMPDKARSICCFYGCLSTYKKSTSCLNLFLGYWTFRNLGVWLVESMLEVTEDLELCKRWNLGWKASCIIIVAFADCFT